VIRLFNLLLILLFGCNFICNSQSTGQPRLKSILDSLNIQKKELSILIDKSDYSLKVIKKDKVLKTYPVVFGSNPVDDKLQEGDRCTPEGTFHLKSKYPHKSWNKFIWLDYPNDNSLVKIKKAKAEKRIPMNASPGGEVGIHGVPIGYDSAIDKKQNWTWGCISLKNKDVDEIYDVITTTTPIIIQK
jgi:murein L,D-transpeptidase YafK